jgi:hypothetical protein
MPKSSFIVSFTAGRGDRGDNDAFEWYSHRGGSATRRHGLVEHKVLHCPGNLTQVSFVHDRYAFCRHRITAHAAVDTGTV